MNRTINTTDSVTSESTLDEGTLRAVRLLIQMILMVSGSLGNILVCVTIIRAPSLRSCIGHIFLLNLSISDLGVLMLSFPFNIIKELYPLSWPFGWLVCKTLYPLSDIFYGVSISTITAIAVYRFKGIVLAMEPQITTRAAHYVIAATWAIPCVSICMPLFLVMEFTSNGDQVDCTPHWPDHLTRRLYLVSLSVLWYLVPMIIICYAYHMIRQAIKSSDRLRKTMRQTSGQREVSQHRARLESNSRALKILTPLVIVFAVTMLPYSIFRVLLAYYVNMEPYTWYISTVCVVPMVLNAAVDPLVYCLASSDFRRAIKDTFCCGSGRKRARTPMRVRAMTANTDSVFK